MRYKLIACDLDETLLSRDCSICERNLKAIHRAIELGVKFVPATGRGFESVQGVLDVLGVRDAVGQYVMSFNGGVITENAGNRIIDIDPLPFETVQRLCAIGRSYDLCMHFYTEKEVYVYKPDASELAFLKNRLEFVPLEKPEVGFLEGRHLIKVLFMYEDYGYLTELYRQWSHAFGECEVSYSSNRYIEFNHKGVDKGRGLVKLAQRMGILVEETIAIGDNVNDVPMLKAAGLGVGVANVFDGIRDVCDVITDADNNDGGVAEVIEKYILNA